MPNYDQRRISNLTKETYALVLAGGRGSRLFELTDGRAKPATYFGGKFRIIDFPLSNCINSGIRKIGIATQYKSHSLIRHVNRGWGHFKKELGDVLWYVAALCRISGVTMEEVMQHNIDKLKARYPEGYQVERSNFKEGEAA